MMLWCAVYSMCVFPPEKSHKMVNTSAKKLQHERKVATRENSRKISAGAKGEFFFFFVQPKKKSCQSLVDECEANSSYFHFKPPPIASQYQKLNLHQFLRVQTNNWLKKNFRKFSQKLLQNSLIRLWRFLRTKTTFLPKLDKKKSTFPFLRFFCPLNMSGPALNMPRPWHLVWTKTIK